MLKHNLFKNIIFLIIISSAAYSQCSDAGVCRIGKEPLLGSARFNNSITLSYIFGTSGTTSTAEPNDNAIKYHTFLFETELRPFETSRFNLSVPYNINTGPQGTVNGIGDIIFLWTQFFNVKPKQYVSVSGGVKMPSGKSNIGDTIRQSHQPGSGTTDILIGAGYIFGSFYVEAGFQKTLGKSQNFTQYKKGDDLMFKAGWSQQYKKVNVRLEALTIKRINKSEMIDFRVPAFVTISEIPESDFLQVNLLGNVQYNISPEMKLYGYGAFPLLRRNENSDGTRRAFTIGAGVNYSFNIEY